MGVVKRQGHIVSPVSNCFPSSLFYINQNNNFWDTATVSKFDLEKSKVKVMGKVKGLVSEWVIKFRVTISMLNHFKFVWIINSFCIFTQQSWVWLFDLDTDLEKHERAFCQSSNIRLAQPAKNDKKIATQSYEQDIFKMKSQPNLLPVSNWW